MAERKSLDELEILSPRELGEILLDEVMMNDVDLQYIKDILTAGASLNVRVEDGWTALHFVAENNSINAVKLLISAGADLEIRDRYGCTPLHYAVHFSCLDIVRVLISAGASLEAKNNDLWTPLHYAAWLCQVEIIKVLLAAGASKDILDINGRNPWDITSLDIMEKIPELNPNYNG